MIKIKVWDDAPIDISSLEVKNQISRSISDYILNHWNECVCITPTKLEGKYEVEFSITL